MEEFQELVRSRIARRGELARLAKLSGIQPVVIRRWADGMRPSDKNLKRFAPAIGLPATDLLRMCGYSGEAAGGTYDTDEALILSEYRTLSEEIKEAARQAVLALLRGFARTNVHGACDSHDRSIPRLSAALA